MEYHLNFILYVTFYLNNSCHLLYKLTHTSSYINTHNQPSNQHQHSQFTKNTCSVIKDKSLRKEKKKMVNTKIVALLMVVMMVTMGMENILVQARHHHHHHHHSPSPSPSSDFDDSGSKSPSPSPKSKEKSSTYCMIGCSFEKCFHHGKSSSKFGSA